MRGLKLKQLPYEHCEWDCKGMDLYLDETKIQFGDTGEITKIYQLHCRNEALCLWLKEKYSTAQNSKGVVKG